MEETVGLLILGPSGCGKSILARQIALKYLNLGIPVVVEGKYYEKNLDALLDRETTSFGFDSARDLFHVAEALGLKVLIILDGFNECRTPKKAQLLSELEKVKNERSAKLLITAQMHDPLFEPLDLLRVDINFPSQQTKMSIAKAYSGKPDNAKIEALIRVVSTAMEAKMIGEIGSEQVENVSRFSLFEAFLSRKLEGVKLEGFFLLACIAKILSDNISFSLSERQLDKILRENEVPASVYQECLQTKLLESRMGKVSFGHEMFYNFFVAESVVRFSKSISEITTAINTPKNWDKKLLIIGSIDDHVMLTEVLSGLTDVNLLVALASGDGGGLCSSWIERQISKMLQKIEQEIDQLKYEMSEDSLTGVNFVKSTLTPWTGQELALIGIIPHLLTRGRLIKEIFGLTAKLDSRGNEAAQALWDQAHRLNRSVRYGIFASTYVGLSGSSSAMTIIFSTMHSGFSTSYGEKSIPVEVIEQLLKERSLKHGQFYFLLLLLRWDDKLKLLYEYAISALTMNWKKVPYHLFNEILDNVTHFAAGEEQRRKLIDVLNAIHGEIQDPWRSTMIFDALSVLGALEDDATAYISVAKDEIERILNFPKLEENWSWAANMYNRQFDHPYSYAYQVAINDLGKVKKKIFYEMALKGTSRSFFASSILIEATLHLQEGICPLIKKWMEDPIFEKTTPQDSLGIFLLSHVIYAKYNYPIHSHFADVADPLKKSLFAAAEIYYWINRGDLNEEQKVDQTAAAVAALFYSENQYVIDTLYESRHNILSTDSRQLWEDVSLKHIEDFFPESCLEVCRLALQRLGWQKEVLGFNRGGSGADLHAVYMCERLGGLIDVELLRGLSEHPLLGESAVEVIKSLSRKSS